MTSSTIPAATALSAYLSARQRQNSQPTREFVPIESLSSSPSTGSASYLEWNSTSDLELRPTEDLLRFFGGTSNGDLGSSARATASSSSAAPDAADDVTPTLVDVQHRLDRFMHRLEISRPKFEAQVQDLRTELTSARDPDTLLPTPPATSTQPRIWASVVSGSVSASTLSSPSSLAISTSSSSGDNEEASVVVNLDGTASQGAMSDTQSQEKVQVAALEAVKIWAECVEASSGSGADSPSVDIAANTSAATSVNTATSATLTPPESLIELEEPSTSLTTITPVSPSPIYSCSLFEAPTPIVSYSYSPGNTPRCPSVAATYLSYVSDDGPKFNTSLVVSEGQGGFEVAEAAYMAEIEDLLKARDGEDEIQSSVSPPRSPTSVQEDLIDIWEGRMGPYPRNDSPAPSFFSSTSPPLRFSSQESVGAMSPSNDRYSPVSVPPSPVYTLFDSPTPQHNSAIFAGPYSPPLLESPLPQPSPVLSAIPTEMSEGSPRPTERTPASLYTSRSSSRAILEVVDSPLPALQTLSPASSRGSVYQLPVATNGRLSPDSQRFEEFVSGMVEPTAGKSSSPSAPPGLPPPGTGSSNQVSPSWFPPTVSTSCYPSLLPAYSENEQEDCSILEGSSKDKGKVIEWKGSSPVAALNIRKPSLPSETTTKRTRPPLPPIPQSAPLRATPKCIIQEIKAPAPRCKLAMQWKTWKPEYNEPSTSTLEPPTAAGVKIVVESATPAMMTDSLATLTSPPLTAALDLLRTPDHQGLQVLDTGAGISPQSTGDNIEVPSAQANAFESDVSLVTVQPWMFVPPSESASSPATVRETPHTTAPATVRNTLDIDTPELAPVPFSPDIDWTAAWRVPRNSIPPNNWVNNASGARSVDGWRRDVVPHGESASIFAQSQSAALANAGNVGHTLTSTSGWGPAHAPQLSAAPSTLSTPAHPPPGQRRLRFAPLPPTPGSSFRASMFNSPYSALGGVSPAAPTAMNNTSACPGAPIPPFASGPWSTPYQSSVPIAQPRPANRYRATIEEVSDDSSSDDYVTYEPYVHGPPPVPSHPAAYFTPQQPLHSHSQPHSLPPPPMAMSMPSMSVGMGMASSPLNARHVVGGAVPPALYSPWSVPTQAAPPPPPPPARRHDVFWFEDGSVVFQVEDRLYKVHRYFFERHSTELRSMLRSNPASTGVYFGSPPVVLPDVKKVDFEKLLLFFYPSNLTSPDLTSVSDWTSVLTLACRFSMLELRSLAIDQLTRIASAVDKLEIAAQLGLTSLRNINKDWLIPAYTELCSRGTPLTKEEGERVGVQAVIKIWEAQSEIAKSAPASAGGPSMYPLNNMGGMGMGMPPQTPFGPGPPFASTSFAARSVWGAPIPHPAPTQQSQQQMVEALVRRKFALF